MTPSDKVAKRLQRIADGTPWVKGQMHAIVKGWSVATQGHFIVAVNRELSGLAAEDPYERLLPYAEKVIGLPISGQPIDGASLRRWAVTKHCRSCHCEAVPMEGKLSGVLLNRHYLAEILHAVKPLGGDLLVAANAGGVEMVPADPRATSGTHVVLFGTGWRALVMALRTAPVFAEFPSSEPLSAIVSEPSKESA